jgi:hypothetical protein
MIDVRLDRLFNNRLNHIRDPETTTMDHDVVEILYRKNNLGFRGDDFDVNNEILFLGCSHTFGDGLMEEDIWPFLLAKKMNLKFSNLAEGGDSSIIQIIKAFKYFEKIGNPKIIIALFPSKRMPTPFVPGKLESSNKQRQKTMMEDKSSALVEVTQISPDVFDKYSKAPHNPEFIFTEEMSLLYELHLIDMLRIYCKLFNIKFVWSNWDPDYQIFYHKEINKIYPEYHKDYCFIDEFLWNPNKQNGCIDIFKEPGAIDCHKDRSHHPLFYQAADRKGNKIPHWGVHKHIHIAEAFYNHIESSSLN